MSTSAPPRGGYSGSRSPAAWKQGSKHSGISGISVPSATGQSQQDQQQAKAATGDLAKKSHGGGGFLDLPASAAPIVDIGLNLCHKSFKATIRDIVSRALVHIYHAVRALHMYIGPAPRRWLSFSRMSTIMLRFLISATRH